MLAKRKGASREGWSEGSVEQTCDLTNRNRIQGSTGGTSWLETAKSISIKVPCCRSGGCAGKVIELTAGDLCRCPTGLRCVVRRPERGTEVSRGHSRRGNEPVAAEKAERDRKTHPLKARTVPGKGINGEVSRMCDLWV